MESGNSGGGEGEEETQKMDELRPLRR